MKVKDTKTPDIGRQSDCGYDCYVPNTFEPIILQPHQSIKIPLGLCFDIPQGYGLFCFDRSSVSTKIGLKVLAPVIDPCYTGECSACVFNYTEFAVPINPGMKIIQMVLLPYIKPQIEIVEQITKQTTRGNKGFGSTGK